MNLKLTDQDLRTYNGHQWTPGEWCETSGEGDLCGPGWIHYYEGTPELALALNPIHADIAQPRLWRVEIEGEIKRDRGLKAGCTRLRLVEELPVPALSREALTRWAIYVVRAIPGRHAILAWESWADRWLSGGDQARAAEAAARAAWATRAAWAAWAACAAEAAWAAAWAAAEAAAAAAAEAAAAEAAPEIPLADLLRQAIEDEARVSEELTT